MDDLPADSHIGVGIGYTTGALSLHANYGEFSGAGAQVDVEGFGLAAAYDLGGGAVVHLGYGDGDTTNLAGTVNTGSFKTLSLGLGLSF
jgi:outer membrane protein OmpU